MPISLRKTEITFLEDGNYNMHFITSCVTEAGFVLEVPNTDDSDAIGGGFLYRDGTPYANIYGFSSEEHINQYFDRFRELADISYKWEFRTGSLERVSSPEQLNDYIRVANPSVWMALTAVMFLLIGICVWGVFGRLETVLTVDAMTEGEQTVCYVRESDIGSVSPNVTVRLNGEEYEIAQIAPQPIQTDADFPDYLAHISGISHGEWVYAVTLEGTAGTDGGIYEAQIVIESIAPASFVIN